MHIVTQSTEIYHYTYCFSPNMFLLCSFSNCNDFEDKVNEKYLTHAKTEVQNDSYKRARTSHIKVNHIKKKSQIKETTFAINGISHMKLYSLQCS